MTAKTARTRKSFKNDAPKINVNFGELQHDAMIATRDAAAESERLAAIQLSLEETFADLPVQEAEASDAVLDLVAQEIAAEEMRDELQAPATPTGPSFRELMDLLDDTDIEMAQRTINAAIDERAQFELQKKGDGHNIQRTLKKAREGMGVSKAPARVLIAAAVDTAFVNRTQHDGSRYNVYAIDKVVDILRALGSDAGEVKNAINRACLKSIFALQAAGHAFSLELAKACASDKYGVEIAVRKHLTRHTVSASTAPTQASSTMQALETLGVVKREGSSRNPTFTLTDAPITAALKEKIQKAA
ncbi:hypothetical protein [Methylobacterium sp. AMS5]|uniref:hypothetical protein n=1 Tax=Methylobacterium sp. AMS5 TaxID=925818 RepID=UPI00074F9677|nr:hypothetical protein [Methylobacterium sp. AMS5]AMB48299.1 hypothetical protein Y590_25360 [Methylobacterium sp. AMS5]